MIYIELDIDFNNDKNQENIKPLVIDVICPKMKSNGKENNVKNWSTEQCLIRIRERNRCTFRCPIAAKLKEAAKKLNRKI